MLEQLPDWLAPTVDDPELARRQRLLNVVLLGLAVPGFIFGLVSAALWAFGVMPNAVGVIAGLGVQVFYLLSYWLSRRGWVRWAGYIPVTVLFLTMVGTNYQMGIGHVVLIGYAMVTTTAGILLGTGPALAFTLLSTLSYLVIGRAQMAGQLPAAMPPESTLAGDAAGLAFGLIVLVIFNGFYNREVRRALHREREVCARLEANRIDLEQEVSERTDDLRRRTVQMETAAEVSRDAAAIHDVDDLLDETVRLISDRFGFYHAGLFLLDEEGKYAVLKAASSEGGEHMLARGHKLRVGRKGIVGYAADAGEPRIALDVGDDAVFFDNPDLPQTHSEMALPLVVRGRVIGVLDVQSTEPEAFTEEDVSILQTMADQVALAIENARLLGEAQDRLREVSALLGTQSREGWRRMMQRRPDWGYDYDGVRVKSREETDGEEEEPELTAPLQVHNQIIGDVSVKLGDRRPTSEEEALAQAVADRAGQALESARLFHETQEALRRLEALNAITNTINRSLHLDEVLEEALTQALSVIGFEIGLISIVEPGGQQLRLVMHQGLPEKLLRQFQGHDLTRTLCGMVYQKGEMLAVEDLTQEGLEDVDNLVEAGIRSYLGVPVVTKDEVVGTLCAFERAPHTFQSSLLAMLQTVGQQIGVAVENARLFEQTRRRAERERLVTEITSRVRASTDVDTILRTAIGELGKTLRASDGLIRLQASNGGKFPQSDEG